MSDILNNQGAIVATYSSLERAQKMADQLRAVTGENYTVQKIA